MPVSAVVRTPVEIWQRILQSAVFVGPLLPRPEDGLIENMLVFQSDCAVTSAYYVAECTSRRLGLVCRSWRTFLSSLSNGFVAISHYSWPTDPPDLQSSIAKANQILLAGSSRNCVCEKPCRHSQRWRLMMIQRGIYPTHIEGVTTALTDNGELAAQALHVRPAYSDHVDWEHVAGLLPNLRVLSADLSRRPSLKVQDMFQKLTHLELRHFDVDMFRMGLTCPSLTTLFIDVRLVPVLAILQDWSPIRTWNLPMLMYLFVKGEFNRSFYETHLRTLLQTTGPTLRGFCAKQTIIHNSSLHGFAFPEEIWEWCPNLRWLGGTAQSLVRAYGPPPSVSLESILVLHLFGRDKSHDGSETSVRETADLAAAFSNRNVDHFRIGMTWERWLLYFFDKTLVHRAEWANFLAQFGLLGKRHGASLRDVDGVSFDDERTSNVRQAVQVEVAALSERLLTTSWTNRISRR